MSTTTLEQRHAAAVRDGDQPKKMLFFVRHAEGWNNVSDRRVAREAALTAKGRADAELLADRCAALKPDGLYCSTVFRAVETASYISRSCQLDIMPTILLNERKRPSEVNGRSKNDPAVVKIDRTLRENFHLPQWRFSDEENFDDLKIRTGDILQFLESRSHSRIIAVTHGILIRVIIARALFGDELDGKTCEQFIRGCRMHRSGITAISVNHNVCDEGIASRFQLWMWNDFCRDTYSVPRSTGAAHACTLVRKVPTTNNRSLRGITRNL